MAKAPPSFQFYPADFLVGTAHLDAEAIGCYWLLLCYQWAQTKLPSNPAILAGMCRKTEAEFTPIWEKIKDKFMENGDGMIFNERLEVVRRAAVALSQKRAESGRQGGLSKCLANAKQTGKQNTKQKRSKGSVKCEDRSMKSKDRRQKPDNSIVAVVEHYQTYHPKAQAGSKERAKISDRLAEGFSVDDLTLAVDGCHVSPWHCGTNPSGAKYHSLELIFRDASKVTQFIEHAQTEGDPKLSEKSRRSLDAIGKWMEKKKGIKPHEK